MHCRWFRQEDVVWQNSTLRTNTPLCSRNWKWCRYESLCIFRQEFLFKESYQLTVDDLCLVCTHHQHNWGLQSRVFRTLSLKILVVLFCILSKLVYRFLLCLDCFYFYCRGKVRRVGVEARMYCQKCSKHCIY